ncbi:RE1 [Symbiodinium sp. CCMP2592]|nr:RE1 [Symbiodinium sp. CCMP2592]
MFGNLKLEVDRFGVPQYHGDPDLFEEYCERAWGLWYGRQGAETQAATPVHLRSGLQGSAYESVRLLKHDKIITKDENGKATEVGIKLFLATLKESIAAEAPVKVKELFFQAFYSPAVWRRSTETMQQYIVRREQDFKRLEDVLPGSAIPEHIRAMMLLAFGGLDHREPLGVLSIVNNEYDFKKERLPGRPRQPKGGKGNGKNYVRAVSEGDFPDTEDPEAEIYYEDDGGEAGEDGSYADDSTDLISEGLDALVQECDLDDQELADAFATIMQRKKKPSPSTATSGKGHSLHRLWATRALEWRRPVSQEEGQEHEPTKGKGPHHKKGAKTSYFVLPDTVPDAMVVEENYVALGHLFQCPGDRSRHGGEVMMVNKIGDEVCEHCVYNGGSERKLHRAANGHSRSVSCKEPDCDKVIFTAKRKEPAELWRFLVLVALTTKSPFASADWKTRMLPQVEANLIIKNLKYHNHGEPGAHQFCLQPPMSRAPTYVSLLTCCLRFPNTLEMAVYWTKSDHKPLENHRSKTKGPYVAEVVEEPWDCPRITSTLREKRLKRIIGYEEEAESSYDENSEEDVYLSHPSEVFLTGKAVKSEVRLKDLDPKDRERFTGEGGSMAKEWNSWNKFAAVDKLEPHEIRDLPSDVKIIGTRWVHTDKNAKPRLLAEYLSKRTEKGKAQIKKEFPFEAKSRLVVQGCQEDATGIRPPPPGVQPGDLFRARGSIYGTKDAGRSWWKKLFKTLREHRWVMSKIEAALFFLVKGTELIGIMVSHVDDLFAAGEGTEFDETITELAAKLYLKVKRGEFRFCGKNIVQKENGIIEIDLYDAIESINLDPSRRKQPNAVVTEEEKSSFRALIGQMGWVTRQSRPDIMVNVSLASQSMGRPTIKDVVDLNRAVKMLK